MNGFTRTYAAAKLLEHGPLTLREIVAITHWPQRSAQAALTNLQITGAVRTRRVKGLKCRANEYRLADAQSAIARPNARVARNSRIDARGASNPSDWHEGPSKRTEPKPWAGSAS